MKTYEEVMKEVLQAKGNLEVNANLLAEGQLEEDAYNKEYLLERLTAIVPRVNGKEISELTEEEIKEFVKICNDLVVRPRHIWIFDDAITLDWMGYDADDFPFRHIYTHIKSVEEHKRLLTDFATYLDNIGEIDLYTYPNNYFDMRDIDTPDYDPEEEYINSTFNKKNFHSKRAAVVKYAKGLPLGCEEALKQIG